MAGKEENEENEEKICMCTRHFILSHSYELSIIFTKWEVTVYKELTNVITKNLIKGHNIPF